MITAILGSCAKHTEKEIPTPAWITMPQYDFPIYVAKRGGVVTTSLDLFDITGFMEVGDSTAFQDTLEWKVIPYNPSETKSKVHFPEIKSWQP